MVAMAILFKKYFCHFLHSTEIFYILNRLQPRKPPDFAKTFRFSFIYFLCIIDYVLEFRF